MQHDGVVLETIHQATERLTNVLHTLLILISQATRQQWQTVGDEMKVVRIQGLAAIGRDSQRRTLSGNVEKVDKLQARRYAVLKQKLEIRHLN